ncbi:G2/M phase-specific E3 ubiquitin-protein ligase-like [Pungitius pungitius]|uniref:G2/M phase-specific E3 ubiquitin-protein ligase-like n=1 Tax=Pungitius pungitius TaxID=134920 RepID=UPI001887C4EF
MVVTPTPRPIFISRSNVWTTAFRQFNRPRFSESSGMLYVTFASDEMEEDAEDLGGPRREFFRLLVRAIFQGSGAFEESPNGFTPKLNIAHVQNGVYRTIGKMMSTIIVQGGEPPAFLAPHVVDYIVTEDILQVRVTPDDIADAELRDSLKKVKQASTVDELEEALDCCDTWRFQIEGLPNPVTMDRRNEFIRNATLYHVILHQQSCFNQLMDGLSYYGVLPLLREHRSMRIFLDMPEKRDEVTAEVLACLLKPSYSVLGSNKRPKEELMVVKFREFLQCVENKELGEILGARTLTEEEKDFVQNLGLGHILAFATGSSKIPAVGFQPNPKIVFIHDEIKRHPVAHTCSNELLIFVNAKNMADDDEFEYCFVVALMNGALFSTI